MEQSISGNRLYKHKTELLLQANKMISKRLTKMLLLGWISIFLVLGCQNTQASPETIPPEIIQPQPSVTPSKVAISTPTVMPTFTPAPNYCSRESVPATMLDVSSEIDNSKRIAFMSGTNGFDDIYVMNLDGSGRINITNDPAIDRFPIWSPDGKKIAFLSNRNYPTKDDECLNMISNDCVFEIFVSNSNGGSLAQISQGWNFSPHWSPNSEQIAYAFHFPDPAATPDPVGNRLYYSNIYIVNGNGSNEKNLTRNFQPGFFSDPIWSPDSTRLAFATQGGIVLINSDGTDAREYSVPDIRRVLYWSKDNSYILFMSNENQIVKSNLDFTEFQKMPESFISSDPAIKFSPDGKWFAYKRFYLDSGTGTSCNQIRIANVETLQDYFVYDEKDVGTAAGDALTPVQNAIGISRLEWLGNDKLLFTQLVNRDVIFAVLDDLFVINADGTGLKYLSTDVSSFSVQP